jgi:hypothetical protein
MYNTCVLDPRRQARDEDDTEDVGFFTRGWGIFTHEEQPLYGDEGNLPGQFVAAGYGWASAGGRLPGRDVSCY